MSQGLVRGHDVMSWNRGAARSVGIGAGAGLAVGLLIVLTMPGWSGLAYFGALPVPAIDPVKLMTVVAHGDLWRQAPWPVILYGIFLGAEVGKRSTLHLWANDVTDARASIRDRHRAVHRAIRRADPTSLEPGELGAAVVMARAEAAQHPLTSVAPFALAIAILWTPRSDDDTTLFLGAPTPLLLCLVCGVVVVNALLRVVRGVLMRRFLARVGAAT